jgi:hypothetical protein
MRLFPPGGTPRLHGRQDARRYQQMVCFAFSTIRISIGSRLTQRPPIFFRVPAAQGGRR